MICSRCWSETPELYTYHPFHPEEGVCLKCHHLDFYRFQIKENFHEMRDNIKQYLSLYFTRSKVYTLHRERLLKEEKERLRNMNK